MDTEFLVQMRQSNKCGSVRNDEIFNLHLGSGADDSYSVELAAKDIKSLKLSNFTEICSLTSGKKYDITQGKNICCVNKILPGPVTAVAQFP